MPINKLDYIQDKLSYIQSKINNDNKLQHYDSNKKAEDIFIHLLNLTHGWNLKNANDEVINFPAIDLMDTTNEIVIQVTSDTKKKKVKEDTVEAFNKLVKEDKYKMYADYEIKMFYIKDKPSKSTLKNWEEEGLISQSNILGIEDINKKISADPTHTLATKVFKYLCNRFHDKACESETSPQLTTKLGKSILIGREKELQEIDKRLKASKTLLVKGIGGVGKSTIVSNYLHRHKNEYDYYGFFEGINGFIKDLEIKFKVESQKNSLDIILHKLRDLNENKLLVIDDVKDIKENQEKLEKILGLEHNGYRMLLTSRFKVKNIEIYPLLSLDPLDAQKLFLDNYKTEELEKVNQITECLDYHPLFVELVATTIATMSYTLDEILKKFEYGELAEIKLIDDEGDEVSFNQNLKELFEMQKDKLKDEYLLLLKQLAILPSIDIELNFLNEIFSRKLNGQWDFLLKQGWLIKSENGYKLHEIIKQYLLLPENAPSLEDIEIIVEYFCKYTNKDDIWVVHLESVARFLEKSNFRDEKVSKLYFQIATIFYKKFGNYKKAKKYFILNKEIIEEKGLEGIEISHNHLSLVTGKLDDLEESYTHNSKALEVFEKNNDKESIAICDDILGGIYWKKQELEQSEFFYQKALNFYLSTTNIIQQANIYNNISLIYKDKGIYPKSHELLEKAIELDIDDKKEVAQYYNNRGELYTDEEKYELAEKDILLALNMREELYLNYELDENHDVFAESYDNLAIIYFERGEYKEAKIEQDKAIEIWSYNHDDNYSYLIDARERLMSIEKELQNE